MFNKIVNYLKNSKSELKKVNWPTKRVTLNYTLLVIGISILVAVFLALADYIFSSGIEKMIIR